jgi:hypothetical protein
LGAEDGLKKKQNPIFFLKKKKRERIKLLLQFSVKKLEWIGWMMLGLLSA